MTTITRAPGDAPDAGGSEPPAIRRVSLQVHLWTTFVVPAASPNDAMAVAQDRAREVYGDDIYINPDSIEVD